MISALVFSGYLLFFTESALESAKSAMKLWAEHVAPALFPFIVLMPVLSGDEAQRAYKRIFGRILTMLFRLPGEAAAPVLIGWMAGSPAGAMAVSEMSQRGILTPRQTFSAAVLASGAGPVFLICSVGVSMFQSAAAGVRILLSMYLSLVFTAFIASRLPEKFLGAGKAEPESADEKRRSGVSNAVNGILTVCGWMVLFAVISGPLPIEVAWIMEISAGCALAAERGMEGAAAFAAGFGGACCAFQNLDRLRKAGVNAICFTAAKLFCGLMSAAFHRIMQLLPEWEWALPALDPFSIAVIIALMLALHAVILNLYEAMKKPMKY